MPPRIPNSRRLSTSFSAHISSTQSFQTPFSRPSIPSKHLPSCASPPITSPFSSSPSAKARAFEPGPEDEESVGPGQGSTATKLRVEFYSWLKGVGANFKHPIPGATNYLTAYDKLGKPLNKQHGTSASDAESGQQQQEEEWQQEKDDDTVLTGDGLLQRQVKSHLRPFPLNPTFVSQSVLSEDLRNEIYQQVKVKGKGVRAVSVLFGVDMRRVAAVVRLVELEKQMIRQEKPLALPYARAIHQMIPTTPLGSTPGEQVAHEPINDLPVHRLTDPQIFYPVSESRSFTRVDAGRVFSAAPALLRSKEGAEFNTPEAIAAITQNPKAIEKVGEGAHQEQVLQPADVRIPHPHLVSFEHDHMTLKGESRQRNQRFLDRLDAEEAAEAKDRKAAKQKREARIERVEPANSRFEYRFESAMVTRENTGKECRGRPAPGYRYGVPSNARKRGVVKIPTKVEV
ncbi:hypothetical protein LOZ65_003455 [Ophidiomyces ophidiicola]|nr:hypothetical protein LOZ65_003455 [Ophidiomyces ophidiicola]